MGHSSGDLRYNLLGLPCKPVGDELIGTNPEEVIIVCVLVFVAVFVTLLYDNLVERQIVRHETAATYNLRCSISSSSSSLRDMGCHCNCSSRTDLYVC